MLKNCLQVDTATSAMMYMSVGYDNSWDHAKWVKDFEIIVVSMKHDTAVFELINVDPSIVNSLRRILIAEVPSVAIENVFVVDYDCVVPEEVLSHRLGLVPLAVDAEKLEERVEEKADHTNTVVFKLLVACHKVRAASLLLPGIAALSVRTHIEEFHGVPSMGRPHAS